MQKTSLRPDKAALLWASLASVTLWVVPVVGLLSLPLEYLNVLIHEMCHAVSAVATGGRVEVIEIFPDGSGVTPIWGGMPQIVGSAGYIGASLVGVLVLLFSRTPEGARTSLRILAVSLSASLLLWVRGPFGIMVSVVWVALLFGAAAYLPAKGTLFAATFFGIQQCLHSLMALLTLAGISLFSQRHSDALLLQQTTGLPAAFWAVGWMGFSFLMMAVALKGILRN